MHHRHPAGEEESAGPGADGGRWAQAGGGPWPRASCSAAVQWCMREGHRRLGFILLQGVKNVQKCRAAARTSCRRCTRSLHLLHSPACPSLPHSWVLPVGNREHHELRPLSCPLSSPVTGCREHHELRPALLAAPGYALRRRHRRGAAQAAVGPGKGGVGGRGVDRVEVGGRGIGLQGAAAGAACVLPRRPAERRHRCRVARIFKHAVQSACLRPCLPFPPQPTAHACRL